MASDASNKINEMKRNIPDQSDGFANNISQLEDIRDELQEQATAIEDGLLDVSANRLLAFLQGKALAIENGYTYKGLWEIGGTYSVGDTVVISPDDPLIDSSSSNFAHYQCLIGNTGSEANFPPNSPLIWTSIPYVLTIYRVRIGSEYNSSNLTNWSIQIETWIPPVPNPTPPPLFIPGYYTWIDIYSLTVNWDSNAQVIELISDWNYGYDLLTKELNTGGTYGLYANIANTNVAISLLNTNKNKVDAGDDVYSRYIP